MKKIKMFGFAFLLMFVSIMGTNALELGDDISSDGKITYTKEALETFSYQIVKVDVSKLASIEAQAETLTEKMLADLETFERAYEDFEADDTNSDLENAYNKALETLKKDMDELNALVATIGNHGSNWTEVSENSTSGTIDAGVLGADEAYIVWIKSDYFVDVVTDGIMVGGLYTQDNVINVPTDVTGSDVGITTSKKGSQITNVKNPKTGVDLPIAGGILVIVLASAGICAIRKMNA